jgi:uncharacterized tellurite resistance protein B-like protein
MRTTELSYASLEVNKLEAFLELMFLAAHADGEVHELERAAFREQVIAETHGQLEPELIDMMLAQIEVNLVKYPRNERLDSIRERLTEPRLRRAALQIAARIIRADGKVVPEEVTFYESAAKALGIERPVAREILEKPDWVD